MKYLILVLVAILSFPAELTTAATDVKNDASLSTGLVSYWELEETTGTRVDSHGANDLTAVNAPGYAAAVQGNGADFENEATNNEQKLTITDGSQTGLDTQGDFAVSAWVNVETFGTGDHTPFVSKTDPVGGYGMFSFGYYKPTNRFYSYVQNSGACTGAYTVLVNYTLNTATQYHLVWNYDESAGSVELFVNGAFVATSTGYGTNLLDCAGDFFIANSEFNGENLDGVVDEVGFWNRTITPADVTALYNGGAGIPYDAGGPAPEPVTPYSTIIGDTVLQGDVIISR
jgi:hypothetical protein